jgi:hypothetical protein
MACACNDPIKKLEARVISRGFERMSNSDIKLMDNYIHSKLAVYPTSMAERKDLFSQAKKA